MANTFWLTAMKKMLKNDKNYFDVTDIFCILYSDYILVTEFPLHEFDINL